jgi:hypothetical protein
MATSSQRHCGSQLAGARRGRGWSQAGRRVTMPRSGRKELVGWLVGCGPQKEVKVSYLTYSYFYSIQI